MVAIIRNICAEISQRYDDSTPQNQFFYEDLYAIVEKSKYGCLSVNALIDDAWLF